MKPVRLTAVAAVLGILVWVGGASADTGGRASCAGIEFSSISPPGSSDEFPNGARELVQELHVIADALGAPPGALVGSAAKLHEGSHAACDEALE